MQWLTRLKLKLADAWARLRNRDGSTPAAGGARWRWLLPVLVVLVLPLWYLFGVLFMAGIDEDLAFRPSPQDLPAGGSVAVAMASGIMDREVNEVGWTPNNPWFSPTYLIDNLPNYQEGERRIIAQFTLEMRDQIGRLRGTGAADTHLNQAVSNLSFAGDRWYVNHDRPILSLASESFYRDAITAMRAYNQEVAAGKATYERRADALEAVLTRIGLALGDSLARTDDYVATRGGTLFEGTSDDIFYQSRGEVRAAYLVLSGLRQDFAPVIRARGLDNLWNKLMHDLRQINEMDPLIVLNGEAGGMMLKSHLAEQGFMLSNARVALREITAVLQK